MVKKFATGIDALRRSAMISKLDRKTNDYIRGKIRKQNTILDEITGKQLIWCGHVERMDLTRPPKVMINWRPEGREKRGRPRRTWKDGIYTATSWIDIRMERSKAMECGIRKASPDVSKSRNIYIYMYIYIYIFYSKHYFKCICVHAVVYTPVILATVSVSMRLIIIYVYNTTTNHNTRFTRHRKRWKKRNHCSACLGSCT